MKISSSAVAPFDPTTGCPSVPALGILTPVTAKLEPMLASTPAEAGAQPYLSLVIPAFNEEKRLGPTVREVITFLEAKPYDSEVVLSLDGCRDRTAEVGGAFVGRHGHCEVRLIDHREHGGKGAAVRRGMLAARGRYRVFIDADLAYPLRHIDVFLARLEESGGVAVASRAKSKTHYERLARRVGSRVLRGVMSRFVPGVSDTQAGFKGFAGPVADDLFARQRLDGFGFDVEILRIARMRGYPIDSITVDWHDAPGSKVRVLRDGLRVLVDLASVWLNGVAGVYRK